MNWNSKESKFDLLHSQGRHNRRWNNKQNKGRTYENREHYLTKISLGTLFVQHQQQAEENIEN